MLAVSYRQDFTFICNRNYGGLAQLARALAWHARGHRFESGILHWLIKNHES
jgi:hypothetical protein